MKIYTTVAIIFLVFVFFYSSMKQQDGFADSGASFMSQSDTSSFLSQDRDSYVKSMSRPDLYARKASHYTEYRERIAECAVAFNANERKKLTRCAKKADEFLRGHTYRGLDCGAIERIGWVFAKTVKNGTYEYEEGLPHTRENVVFLSGYVINDNIANDTNDDTLVSTLIHEKMHIYQRLNNVQWLVASLGYVEVSPSSIEERSLYLKRSNPDTDGKVYSKNATAIIFSYRNDRPSSINDVLTRNFTIEHPYEEMAYEIANDFTKKRMLEII